MPSYFPPKRGTAYVFHVALVSQANPGGFQVNPTLAIGDVKVSIDGGAFANITTLPTVNPLAGRQVEVSLSAAEMTGDNIGVLFVDAAGAEWNDLYTELQTTARQLDDHAFPTVSGRSLDVSVTGKAGIDWANIGAPTTVVDLSNTAIKTAANLTTNNDKTGYAVGVGGIAATAFAAGAVDAAAIAANAITSSEFAQSAADLVWLSTARTLTEVLTVKKNTALANFMFVMVDSADHVTPKTALTVTVQASLDGLAFANVNTTGAATEISNGWYKINFLAADLNANTVAVKCTATGADQQNFLIVTQPNA